MEEKVSTDPTKVKIKKFKVPFKGKDLCLDASLIIADGKRYGLICLDSCGKTSLLKHIEKGALHIPSDINVLYCWKPDIVDEELAVFEAVLKPSSKCADLLDERKKLEDEQKKGNCKKELNERLAQLWEELLMIDPEGHPAEVKAGKILSGLGFLTEEVYKTVKDISENLKKRASLARALFLEPDLLILDEPTVELDLDATLWLGNYLQDYTKTLIVGSQDRCFLDKICNEIICFDEHETFYYKGNYSVFEKKLLKHQKKKLLLKANRELGGAGVKAQNRSQNETKMDNSEEGRASVQLLQKPEFSFCDPVDFKRSDLVQLLDITFGYEKKKPIFKDFVNGINYRSRVAVLGPSRAGKSTLLRLANNELCPQKGKVYIEAGTRIGWLGENSIRKLPGHESPLQYIYRKAMEQKDVQEKDLKQKVAEQLSGLGLVDRSHTTKMEDLSDSEKARVVLAELCFIPHDCLLMDEPTLYLDIDIIDALAEAINRFNGGLWMVTNNEYLIRETECELGFIKDRDVNYVIDFDDYKRKLLLKLNEPIRGPFVYKKRTSSKIVTTPKLISNSVIIENYIKNNSNVDPSIREIGKYRIVFEEGTRIWACYPPTLGTPCRVTGRTKEICQEAVCERIEEYIEMLINNEIEIPSPP